MWKTIKLIFRLLKGLVGLTVMVALAALAYLYVAERDLPATWLNRLTERISSEQISVQVGRASYGLRRGLVLHRVRAFARGALDPAFLSVDEAVVSLTLRPRRPLIEWVDGVSMRNLRCDNLPDGLLASERQPTAGLSFTNRIQTLDLPGVDLAVAGASLAGMTFDHVAGRLSVSDGIIRLANTQIAWAPDRWPEVLRGEVSLIPDGMRIEGRVAGRTTPARLRPLFERLHARSVIRIGDKFSFTTDPVDADCTFRVAPSAQLYELRVAIKVRNVVYNGVPISEASTVIDGSGTNTLSRVSISPLVVASSSGTAQASLLYLDDTNTLDIDAQGEMAIGPLSRIIEVLDKGELDGIEFARPPKLTVRGRAGVSSNHPAPTELTGTIAAPAAKLYGVPLQDVSCVFNVAATGVVSFTSLAATTPNLGRVAGEFVLMPRLDGSHSSFRTALKVANLSVPELFGFFGATNAPPGKLRGAWEMTGRFASDSPDAPQSGLKHARIVDGDFVFRDGDVLGMALSRLSGRLLNAKDVFRVTGLSIAWPGGKGAESASGELSIGADAGPIEGQFSGLTTPDRLRPLLTALRISSVSDLTRSLDLKSGPAAVDCRFRVVPQEDRYDVKVSLDAKGFDWNREPVRSVQTVITVAGDAGTERVTIDPLAIETVSGSARATLSHDSSAGTLQVDSDINMDLVPLARLIGIPQSGELDCLQFESAPRLLLRGCAALSPRATSPTDLRGLLTAPAVRVSGLPLRNAACALNIGANQTVAITNLTANTPAGGRLAAELFLAPAANPSNTAYRASLSLDAVDLAELFEAFGSSNRPPGKLAASLSVNGSLGPERLRQIGGQGRVAISEGSISRIPLFAGFTDYLARNVPGVEALVNQSNGSFTFTATNGIVSSRNILIEGEVFSLSGKGQYSLADDRLDFLVQAGIFKRGTLIGKVTHLLALPFSKLLLEFRVQGSTANPTWEYLGILQRITETVTEVISPPEDKPKP